MRPHLPDHVIRHHLESRLGAITGLRRLAEGLTSQAVTFYHGAEPYVLRIGTSLLSYAKDAFVQRAFGRPELPIPEVVEVGRLDDRHAYCLSRLAPGGRFHDVDAAARPRLVNPTARLLDAIAASELHGTTGFGLFDADGVAPYTTWRGFLLGLGDTSRFDWDAARHVMDPELLARALRTIERLAAYCPEVRHLVHGDFGSFNVLTDGHDITAVIDWDLALFGDPLYDVANLRFWREEALAPVLEHLLERRPRAEEPGWRERLLAYQLHGGLREIYFSAVLGNAVDASWLVERCEAVLRAVDERTKSPT